MNHKIKTIPFSEFMENLDFYVQEAKVWKIFIYPTDTIYGIGWVFNKDNVKKIADIKNRDWNKMFSVIAPNFEWIDENYKFSLSSSSKEKDLESFIPFDSAQGDMDFLKNSLKKYHWVTWIFSYERPGVRIIKHEFQKFVEQLGEWFITTSVNISWEDSVTNLKTLKPEIKEKVDYIIDFGICEWRPSVLIDFVKWKIIER